MKRSIGRVIVLSALALCSTILIAPGSAQTQPNGHQALLQRYCATCHSTQAKTAGVVLQGVNPADTAHNAELLEKVLRKIKTGQMPPAGMPKPDAAQRAEFTTWLEGALDAEAAAHPNAGRPAIHRLNRAEYGNAIRDVLDLDIDAGALLPGDDTGYGFDNIGDVLSLSPTLLDRYLSMARRISRLALGDITIKPAEETFEPRRETAGQRPIASRLEWISDDLPFNSAGGVSVPYYFPLDAEYVLRANFGNGADKAIELRLPIKAGLREVAVTFPRQSLLPDILPAGGRGGRGGGGGDSAPIDVDLRLDGASLKRSTTQGSLGQLPRLTNLTITGPYNATGSGDTPSRRRILVCRPASPAEEQGCASRILTQLTRHAYRRPVTDADVRPLLAFYSQARAKGPFEYGIQKAVEAILISPDFLFRVESDAAAGKTGANHRVGGVELASRLSFFLWSSVPDDELLGVAEKGKLADPQVLKQQIQRMLDDPKSEALTSNFAGQWLYIRNVDTVKPDPAIFPDFDESLRASMRRETELFFDSLVQENRSAMDLLEAKYTFLNDRLAKHYGIPGIYGSQLRRIELQDSHRGGLLGQASLLTVTSPPNRTSVVQRGKWILDNLLGAPPPPPPPVPSLEATTKGHPNLSLRAAMELHRADPGCAGCHRPMDPLGFALENYNGIGEWRNEDGGSEIDATGKLPDGTEFNGPTGLNKALTTVRREEFATTVASKILTYALGRGLEYYDQPVVRSILRETSAGDYRLRDLITATVMSTPFQMRRSPDR
jgi:mono/diheme cytochrome c family protein